MVLASIALAALAGCGLSGSSAAIPAPVVLRGTVHGGQQPVVGAKVQLYAAGTAGTGSMAVPLLSDPVESDNLGEFSIPSTYDCPSASSLLYLVARGGNPGLASDAENPAIALTAMLGTCGSLSAASPISVNEVTTVGSVWPLAEYMKSTTELGSAIGDAAFSSAAASVTQFINIGQGSSPGFPTLGSYFAQSAKLYSLADVLDKCVNSPGGSAGDGSPCGALFSLAATSGGSAPTETMSAAMRIAQNPSNQVSGIYSLTHVPSAFQPTLTDLPPDWTLQLSHPVATPAISLATGSYVGNQTVTMADVTSGARIYYTTDGSTPTNTSSPYSGPISLSATTTVQAIAEEGISQSAVASSSLTITPVTVAQVPAKLAFLQEPSNAAAGAALTPAVRVVVQDANGNPVPSATNLVRVNLAGVYGLGGTLEIAARNGIATFSNLTEVTAGSYTLAASSPGLTSAYSTTFTIAVSPIASFAAKLVFLKQPSNTLSGNTIAPSVQVALEDAGGNVVTSANNPVTLALNNGTSLTGTLITTPLNGIAVFNNLNISTAGTYTLAASGPGLAPAASAQFTITAPPVAIVAAKLVFLQQPSTAIASAAMAPPVQVALEDASGNIVTGANTPVTLALNGGTSLTGTLTATPLNGVAKFSNLAIMDAGSYTLTASSTNLAPATSTQFMITAPPATNIATKLAFIQQPSNTAADVIMAPPVRVALEDANGNVVRTASGAVTLALTGGTGLTGTLTVSALQGISNFGDLAMNTPGSYTLAASSQGLTLSVSSSFTVNALTPPTASKLAFRQQPSNTVAGEILSPAVSVAMEDNNGNLVTTAVNPVTVALVTGTGLIGTSTALPVNGIATFSNLAVTSAGMNYQLSAASPGLQTANSTSFTISPSTQTVAITVTPSTASVAIATTEQLTASVTGTSDTAVTWALSGTGCTGSSCGTISPTGLYTAPATIPASATVTLTASSVADSSKSASSSLSLVPPQATGYALAWEDTFSTFNVCTTDIASCNWYNPGVYQWAAGGTVTNPSNSYLNLQWSSNVTGGNFTNVSTASPGGINYRAWTFGYFEIKMAFDPSTGSWPGIWMAPTQTIGNPTNNGAELDNFEWQSNTPSTFYGTLHVWQNGVDQTDDNQNAFSTPAGTDFSAFHTYGVLWTKTSVTWYFDNQQVGSFDITQSPYNTVFTGQQSLYLILGQLSGCDWKYSQCPGQQSPLDMKIDWVHVYSPPSAQN